MKCLTNLFKKKKKPTYKPVIGIYDWSYIEKATFYEINKYRREQGLNTFLSENLAHKLAKDRIETIVQVNHSGVGIVFKTLTDFGFAVRELLAFNYTNPESAVKAWIKSDMHNKALIASDYKYCGIAIDMTQKIWIVIIFK